jgi:hypothetical protein
VYYKGKTNTYYGSLDAYHRVRFAAKLSLLWTLSFLKNKHTGFVKVRFYLPTVVTLLIDDLWPVNYD